MSKVGRKAFEPTEKDRAYVETMAGYGIEHNHICKLIDNPRTGKPISPKTLRKTFRSELDTGMVKANVRVTESLFLQCVGAPAVYDKAGKKLRSEQPRIPTASIYWTKARMGWKETSVHEMGGKNGGPVPVVLTKNQSEY